GERRGQTARKKRATYGARCGRRERRANGSHPAGITSRAAKMIATIIATARHLRRPASGSTWPAGAAPAASCSRENGFGPSYGSRREPPSSGTTSIRPTPKPPSRSEAATYRAARACAEEIARDQKP